LLSPETAAEVSGVIAATQILNHLKIITMTRLPKFTLKFDQQRKDWELEHDKTDRILRRFKVKESATKGGVLKKAVGTGGGSVKIQKKQGRYQEERTYPRSADPRRSKG
jgi:hypothetical protein